MPGFGNGAHIGNKLYGMRFQNCEKFLSGMGRVANRVNDRLFMGEWIILRGNHHTSISPVICCCYSTLEPVLQGCSALLLALTRRRGETSPPECRSRVKIRTTRST